MAHRPPPSPIAGAATVLTALATAAAFAALALPLPVQVASGRDADTPPPIAGQVLEADGRPAASAEVILRWRAHPELPGLVGHSLGEPGQLGVVETRHATDRHGRFRIEPPHRGPFLLLAQATGRSSVHTFPVMSRDYRVLRLEPDFELSGVVTAPDGEPVEGARVRLVPDPSTWTRLASYRMPERRATATTAADGSFRIGYEHGYLRGPWLGCFVVPRAEHGGSASPPSRICRPTDSARALVLALGPPTGLAGLIVDESGAPIAGARVYDPYRAGAPAVATDASGRYRVAAPDGPDLFVSATGRAFADVPRPRQGLDYRDAPVTTTLARGVKLRARLLAANGRPLAGARVLFAIPRNGRLPIEWTTRTEPDGYVETDRAPTGRALLAFVETDRGFVQIFGGTIAGECDLGRVQVRHRALEGQFVAGGPTPAAGVRVVLLPVGAPPGEMPRVTYTDRGGRFRFDGLLPDADQQVVAGSAECGVCSAVVAARDLGAPLRLGVQHDGEVSGLIRDEAGRPAGGAWVMLTRPGGVPNGEPPGTSLTMSALCTLTDPDGRFRFAGLPADGTWTLLCSYLHDGVISAGGKTVAPTTTDFEMTLEVRVR